MKNSSGQKNVLAGPDTDAPKEDSRHGDKSCALRARRRALLGGRVSVGARAVRYPTTAARIEHGEADWRRASARAPSVPFDSALILSPVTTPCRIYCQG